MSVEDSAGSANATAGQAVLFAGTTVVIAILGLFVAGLPALTSMGVAVALVVVVAMFAAVTLLPGLLGLAGTKIDKLSIHRKSHVAKPAHDDLLRSVGAPRREPPEALRRAQLRRPVPHRDAGPQHADRDARRRQRPADHDPARARTTCLAEGFGTGFNGPIQVVVEIPTAADRRRSRAHPCRTAGRPRRSPPSTEPVFNAAGDTALLTVNPTTAPQDERTDDARPPPPLRRAPRRRSQGTDAQALLTGQAMITDLTERITSRLPWFIAAIVAMSFVLLMIVFRSILVPLKAALDEPAVDRCRLRRDRRRVPVGLGQRADRRREHDADQPVRSADDVRHPLRALDGLRGVPALPGP